MIREIFNSIYPIEILKIKKEAYKKEYSKIFEIKELEDNLLLKIDFKKCNLNDKEKIILIILGKEDLDKDKLIKLCSMRYSIAQIKEGVEKLKKEKLIKENRGLLKGDLGKIIELWDLTSENL